MERYVQPVFRRHLQYCKVLDYKGVCPGIPESMHQSSGLLQLIVIQDGVEGDEYPRPEPVRIPAQVFDVLHAVPGGLSCPECGTGNIYGIGTAVYCCNADVTVSRGSQKFQLPRRVLKSLHQLHWRACICAFAVAPYLAWLSTF